MRLRLWLLALALALLAAASCLGRIQVEPAEPICPAHLIPVDLARCRLWA